MRFVTLGLSASLCALAVVACNGTAEPSSVPSSADELVQATPIEPVDLLACWVVADTSTTDPFFMAHELRCAPRIPADYPLAFGRFIVEVSTADDKHLSNTFEGSTESLIGTVSNDSFPLTVRTRLTITSDSVSDRGFGLMRETTFESLQQHPEATPELYRAPFSLWPVEITFVGNAPPYVGIDEYVVPVTPYGIGYNFSPGQAASDQLTLIPTAPSTNPSTMLLIEPPSKSIQIALVGRDDFTDFVLTAPGNYEYDGTTLKRLDGDAPAPTPNDPAAPPPVVDPTPECGGQAQLPCGSGSSRSCDAGLRLDTRAAQSSDYRCVPCGRDGQTWCGTYQNPVCEEGLRLDRRASSVADYTCRLCGDAGQTWCGTYQNPTCNVGLRLDRRPASIEDYTCRPCGNDGETWCGSYQSPTCNEGHRLDRSASTQEDYECVACGGDGQTYCGSTSSRFCNEGLRVVEQNGVATCQP